VAIAEGAHFRGSIDMQKTGGGGKSGDQKADSKPVTAPTPGAPSGTPATAGR
jgi:hypothetical protein